MVHPQFLPLVPEATTSDDRTTLSSQGALHPAVKISVSWNYGPLGNGAISLWPELLDTGEAIIDGELAMAAEVRVRIAQITAHMGADVRT